MDENRERRYRQMVANIKNNSLPQPTATSTICNTISHVPTPNASTSPSDALGFKVPQTTRQFKISRKKLDKLDNELSLITTGLRAIKDKKVVQLLLRQIKTGILLAKEQRNVSNSTIPELLGGISNNVMEMYYTDNVPRYDISLQSPRMSDQPMSNAEGCGSIQMSSVPMDRILPSSQTFNQPTVNPHRFETTSAQTVPVPVSSRSVGQLSEISVAQRRGRPWENPKKSVDNLNDSMPLRSSTVVNKKTPPLKNGKSSNKNTPLNTIIYGKENDEFPKKKAAPKKKSVPKKKNYVIIEDKATSSKQAAASKVSKTKKQDSATQEFLGFELDYWSVIWRGWDRVSTKRRDQMVHAVEQMELHVLRDCEEAVRRTVEEKQTMASKKRKSLETDNMAAKKKKVEEEPLESSDIDSDDELFGTFTYKKPTQTALQVRSLPVLDLV